MQVDHKLLIKTLKEILSIPTAPFKEQWLINAIINRFKDRKYFKLSIDNAKNILINYKPPKAISLNLALHAHLDHPGFIFKEMKNKNVGIAEALGGVPENCKGVKVRFFNKSKELGIQARVKRFKKNGKTQEIEVSLKSSIERGSIGMWDFPPLKRNGKWLEGRAFDDNLGSAILIYILEYVAIKKAKYSFSVLFTRAEEVGYVGTLEILNKKSFNLPKNILTLEMPRAGMGLNPGDGVMLRAGDRYINFNSSLLQYLEKIALKIKKIHKSFKSQRRLGLFGGTEVTSFDLNGYISGALCLAVDNGHNINRRRKGRPAPERVNYHDLISMVQMLKLILITPYNASAIKLELKKKVETNYKRLRKRLYV